MFRLKKFIKIKTTSPQVVYDLDYTDYTFNMVEDFFWPKIITLNTFSVKLCSRSTNVYFQALELEGVYIRFRAREWFLNSDDSLVEDVADIVFI